MKQVVKTSNPHDGVRDGEPHQMMNDINPGIISSLPDAMPTFQLQVDVLEPDDDLKTGDYEQLGNSFHQPPVSN